ncbi:MAG: hypothetical protein WA981_12245 [Glaciecola sp.]
MFADFIEYGNWLAVILLTYASSVTIEATTRLKSDTAGLRTPLFLRSSIGTITILLGLPCVILPALYIGAYSGFSAGLISWFFLQIISAIFVVVLGIRSVLGLHFVVSTISMIFGYYLLITTWP